MGLPSAVRRRLHAAATECPPKRRAEALRSRPDAKGKKALDFGALSQG